MDRDVEIDRLRKDLNHDLGLLYKRQEYLKKELKRLRIVVESVASVSEETVVVKDDGVDVGYA